MSEEFEFHFAKGEIKEEQSVYVCVRASNLSCNKHLIATCIVSGACIVPASVKRSISPVVFR